MKEFLRGVGLFADLTDPQVDRLAGLVREERVPAFHTLFREGEPVERLVLVREGTVLVFHTEEGVEQLLAPLEAGHYFGEPGLLNDKARHYASARTATPATLLSIAKPDLVALLTAYPPLELKIRAEISRRHGRHVSALLGLAGQRDVRINLGVESVLELEDGSRLAVVLQTVSVGGLALGRVPAAWQVGDALRFRLGRPGEAPVFDVGGTVVWREGDAVGIAFGPEAAGNAELIHRAVQSLLDEKR